MRKSQVIASGWEFINSSRENLPIMSKPGVPDWLEARVPGYVHTDLVRQGIIAHPFYRMNEAGCQWVDHVDWSYRTNFSHETDTNHTSHILHFHGLDTVCEIFLNGQLIGKHSNAFLPLAIDVSKVIKPGENSLQIDFKSAFKAGEAKRKDYFAKHGLKDPTANFDERSFVRKPQYMFGWDWGPRLISCGITAPVELISSSQEPEISNVNVKQTHGKDGSVLVRVEIETSIAINQHILEASLSDETYFEDLVLKQISDTNYAAELNIETPELWTPFAEIPHLYDLNIEIYREDDTIIQEIEKKIGLKTIQLVQENDEFGESFEFNLNGEPIYILGANWIPDHSFPGTITRSQVFDKVQAAKDMGMNMLRVWGGGLMESEDFYDACDQIGILVWQDFPYGCAYYPDDTEHQSEATEEAEFHIKRLRNRACLAIWCGNNENHTMFDDKWGGIENNPTRHFGENIYHQALAEACKLHDSEHPYVPSSPYGKNKDYVDEGVNHFSHNMGFVGDSHYWDVWHGRGDWIHYQDSRARFSSEFGFASAPSMEVLEEFIDPSAFQPFSAELNWHNKTRKPIETFMEMVNLHYPEIKTVEDLVYYTQLNQRDAMKFGIEHWRTSAYCRGTLIWQLNDCWPVQSWSLMDCFSHWKASAYELRRLHANTLVSLKKSGNSIKALVSQHNSVSTIVKITLQVIDLVSGNVIAEVRCPQTTVKNNSTNLVGEIGIAKFDKSTSLVCAIEDVTQEVVAWSLVDEPKQMDFPAANLTVCKIDDNQIQVKFDGPVVDLWLRETEHGTQFGQNFITSPEPCSMIIETDGPIESLIARSLAGYHKIIFTGPLL